VQLEGDGLNPKKGGGNKGGKRRGLLEGVGGEGSNFYFAREMEEGGGGALLTPRCNRETQKKKPCFAKPCAEGKKGGDRVRKGKKRTRFTMNDPSSPKKRGGGGRN